ncbi:class I SAM-dependent methyltransferase [Fundicoccus ignavus]|uniref:Methyltransferase domain-containing protein n=1 Tax=Fundicoccus ignavus TaxID=2664442 RepID=A0A844C2W3_9LACT|nr:class I SAM-dependent methyltransferase [Fundicoccus ignavus]MRJ48444.1 methyltransferase domain-containing protein [Fundicoccus ignavus]
MNITWDAEKYTEDFSFVHQYGESVTELIESDVNSTLLDLGCGNGTLSKSLLDKGFRVQGIDASKELLELASVKYPEIPFIQADATDFSLAKPVDVVFSNAVFHWIDADKQASMLRCVHRALKENGEFVFEFGGHGNNQLIHESLARTFEEYGYSYDMPFYFPTIAEYATLLEKAQFKVNYAILFNRPTELEGEDGLRDWIQLFVKTPFSVVDNEDHKAVILDTTVKRLQKTLYKDGKWYADYVRLRMKASRL